MEKEFGGQQSVNFAKVTLTLVLELDLDIVMMCHHTKNEVSMSRHSKVISRTNRHTDSMKTLPSVCGR